LDSLVLEGLQFLLNQSEVHRVLDYFWVVIQFPELPVDSLMEGGVGVRLPKIVDELVSCLLPVVIDVDRLRDLRDR
jgi:hypothetical protein